MANSEMKSAIESQQAKNIGKLDPVSLPGFGPTSPPDAFDPQKYKVRYMKCDMDDIGSISELEILETRAIRNDGVYILTKDRMPFMDRMFIVVSYLEKDQQA
jgi:hypothetical protein